MILVDTSVWIDHLRKGDEELAARLNRSEVLTHPFVIGELACGNLRNRSGILTLLKNLPRTTFATDDEVLLFIERNELMGRGIGYVDAHLLAATALTAPTLIWTRDKRLDDVATFLDLAFEAG
jgi:predicted nucleic acid-binding protein